MTSSASVFSPSGFGAGRRLTGITIACAIALLVVALLVIVGTTQANTSQRDAQIFHLLRMTSVQAGLTTVLSLLTGTALAWSLNRLHFPGRNFIASLFAAAIVAPGLVVAFGLLAVWGRSGWASDTLLLLGINWSPSLFGLHGILIAHVILNGAFASRIILNRLDALPFQKLKIGQSLNLTPWQRFRVLDWPAISGALPGLAAVIFLLAFTSFPIVLLLGGGPANQTLEVAIYTAVRVDFDLARAVQLALVQLVFCGLIVGPALYFTPSFASAGSSNKNQIWSDGIPATVGQILVLALGILGFALPLVAVLVKGISPEIIQLFTRANFWRAVITSLSLGLASALVTLGLSLGLVFGRSGFRSHKNRHIWQMAMSAPAYVYLVIPAVVMSLAFFLFVRGLGIAPVRAAPAVVILGNALLALPFAVATLAPALDAIDRRYARLTQSLNLKGWQRWQFTEWPLLRTEIGIVLALGFCFSLGDLGIISMFGTDQFSTLPWMMFRAMGAYRNNDAAAIAAILVIIGFSVFWLAPAILKGRTNA